jgi:hypothetical protein
MDMKFWHALVAAAGLAVVAEARDASACGGAFTVSNIVESQVTQVTGHRMILSISTNQTTLYDQIQFSGDPSSFAWVLPVKGVATVGLSSDALFENLDLDTQVTIDAPVIDCVATCPSGGGTGGGSGSSGPVTVVAQQVVGPYETVQLQSKNPNALTDWLTSHGYGIPSDIAPVIAAYVSAAFDFVALKLVPGKGVRAMKPVRVTTPGAGPVLPLRMVAAGTGTTTPITLWILGEGRYQPTNMPTFEVEPSKLVWDWDTGTSNYATLKANGFTATGGKGWCLEYAQPTSMYMLEAQLMSLVGETPDMSGYADAMGMNAQQNLSDDLAALFSNIPESDLWITRLEGQLSRAALTADLQIGASPDQSPVQNELEATHTTGTTPSCDCGFGGGSGVGAGSAESPGSNRSGSCGVASDRGATGALFGGLGALFGLGLARARRNRARPSSASRGA